MEKVICPAHLPGPGKPSPLSWQLVPALVKTALTDKGCSLLHHWKRRPHHLYVRFQYAPLVYQGDLFYIQRWASAEWGVSPSQIIFPRNGWSCPEKALRHGSLLSQVVRKAIVELLSPEYRLRQQLAQQKQVERINRKRSQLKGKLPPNDVTFNFLGRIRPTKGDDLNFAGIRSGNFLGSLLQHL